MEQDIHERIEDFQLAVVLDEAKFAETIHEEVDAGAGGSNHFGEDFLADLGHNGFWLVGLAEASEEQTRLKRAGMHWTVRGSNANHRSSLCEARWSLSGFWERRSERMAA